MNNFGLGLILNFTDHATSGINLAIGSFQRLNHMVESVNQTTDSAKKGFEELVIAGMAMTAIGNVAQNIGETIMASFTNIVQSTIEVGSTFEQTRITLGTLYKDMDIGEEKTQWMLQFAKTTPFDIESLRGSFIGMKAMGIDASEEMKMASGETQSLMAYLGDLKAFRPDLSMDWITRGLRNAAGGTIRSLDMILDINSEQLLGHKFEDIERDLPLLVQALGVEGMMGKLEGTWEQKLSNIGDSVTLFLLKIADAGLFQEAKNILGILSDALNSLTDKENEARLESFAKVMSNTFSDLLQPVKLVAGAVVGLMNGLIDMSESSPELLSFLTKALVVFGGITLGTGALFQFLGPMITAIATFGLFTHTVGLGGSTAILGLAGSFGKLLPLLGKLGLAFIVLKAAYDTNFLGFKDFIAYLGEVVPPIVENVGLVFKGIFGELSTDEWYHLRNDGLLPLVDTVKELAKTVSDFWDKNNTWIIHLLLYGALAYGIVKVAKAAWAAWKAFEVFVAVSKTALFLMGGWSGIGSSIVASLSAAGGAVGGFLTAFAPIIALAATGIVITVAWTQADQLLQENASPNLRGDVTDNERVTNSHASTGGAGMWEAQENYKQEAFTITSDMLKATIRDGEALDKAWASIQLNYVDFQSGLMEDKFMAEWQETKDSFVDFFTIDWAKFDESTKGIGDRFYNAFVKPIEDLNTKISDAMSNFYEKHPFIAKIMGYGNEELSEGNVGSLDFELPVNDQSFVPFQETLNNLNINTSTSLTGLEESATTSGTNMVANLLNTTSSLPKDMTDRGTETIAGFKLGVDSVDTGALAKDKASKFHNDFKTELGIASPSKVMQELGMYTIQGLLDGMSGSEMAKFVSNTVATIKDAFAKGNFKIQTAVEFLGTGAYDWLQSIGVGGSTFKDLMLPSGGITSYFGGRESETTTNGNSSSSWHEGIDYGLAYGTPVGSAGGGKVVFAGDLDGYGLAVKVDHGGGLVSLYAHLSEILTSVGALVKTGDILGNVGSTGNSTGAHLHFGLYQDGNAIDPLQGFAKGTNNFVGGLAQVNEKGGEIINLPSGSQILPNDKTVEVSKAQGRAEAYEKLLRQSSAQVGHHSTDNSLTFGEGSVIIQVASASEEDLNEAAEKLIKIIDRKRYLKGIGTRNPIFSR